MSDAELLKNEMDVINPNEKIDSQEIEEFLQSDENLGRLGEALNGATSPELLGDFENVLKGLCEKILSQVDISDNQQKIVEYFLDKFGDKYPDLKEKVRLNKVIDECIQTRDILPQNIALLNERNQLFGSEFQDKKNKIKSIIDNKISGISEAVNKIIAANRTPGKSPYTESQVKYIQLWANVNYGENLQIDGKRGQLGASGLRNGENQRITNLYIYRQELITREGVIKGREALKAFPQLTNIPNLNELLGELSNEQQNRVLQNFLEFFLPFKQEGLHFENLIGGGAFETLMIYLILAEKTKGSNVFLAPLTDSDIPSNITNDSDYYLFKAENLKNKIVDENEINLKNNEQFALLLKQRELNRKVGVLNNIIKQINSLDKTKNRNERINLYKQAINLAKDIGYQGCIDQILIQMGQDFTEAEIKNLFSENELKDLKKARTEAEARWKDSEETHDLLSQIDAQNDKKGKWMVQGVTYAEFKQNWPIEANAFDHQLQGPVYNYSGHIGSSKPEIHPAFKKVTVPGCQPIFIRFKNADENKIIQLFNKANRGEINLVIRNYCKQFANNIGNRGGSYNSDTRGFYAERDMNILSLNDLSYSKTNKDGSVSIYKIGEDTPFKTISKEEQENTRRSSAMGVGSILTREMQINGEEFSSLKNGMDGIQNIISKMKDYKLTDFDTDEARRRAVELRNYTKKLRGKKDSIISLRTHLENVKKARNNESLTTDEEQALNNCITQLVVLERAIKEGGAIDKFVDYILNKKNVYSNDETGEQILAFLRDNAIQIITAIGCAVALVAAIPTGGMSLLGMAAIMTAGSMVGSRLGTELNNLVQNTIFKTTIKVGDEEIEIRFDDPSDVRMLWNGKLSLQDFLINAGTEFVTGTVTCFGFMKAGQLIGKSISGYLSKNPNTKAEAFLKRINPKFAETKDPFANQMFENAESKINQNFGRSWANKFRTEFGEELGEETVETGADEIANRFDIPLLGLLVSTWNSLTPGPNNSKLYSNHKVTLNDFYQDGNSNFVMKLDYDLDSPGALDALTSHFEQHGFIKNPDGTFSKPSEIDPNHSEIIQLVPSKASIDIRNLGATMSSFGIMIDHSKDGEAYYGNVDELNAFKSLIENGGKGIVTIDDNGVATFKNPKTTLVIRPQNDYFGKEPKLAVNMDAEVAHHMIVDKVGLPANQFEIPKKDGKCEYTLKDTHKPPENDVSLEQAKECFFHGLDVTAELMDGQQQRSVLSSGSLFLNNPDFMKLGGDIDVATDAQTFRNVALIKGDNGKTKLDQYESDGKIMDLEFTLINHAKLTLKENSNGDYVAEWSDKEGNKHSALVEELIAKGDIRVEFNIPSKDGLLINCEFFPEPKGYGLIQLGTERTEGKVKTYMLNGREVKTVNEELAAMSYMINLAHEFSNNSVEGVQEGKKLKDSVRINNFIQYLSSIGLNTPGDIIAFIDKTVTDYESQVGEQFTIVDDDNNSKTINMSQYLRKGLDGLSDLREALVKIESNYKTVVALESDSWGDSTTITFNEFMSQTYKIKENGIKYVKGEDGGISVDEALVAIEELKSKIDIKDPKNFAYYYEIYQLQTNFIKTGFKKPDKINTTTQEA